MPHNNLVKENKKNIGSLFDRIASKYDLLNHLLTLNIDKYWRKKTVSQIRISDNPSLLPDTKILDVATGTGDLAIEILKQNKTNSIVGIDLSGQMLKIGKDKIRKYISENFSENVAIHTDLMIANVENMPFEDSSFNAVTCAFGVRNFNNLKQGLKECFRILKNNGQIVILEFAYPKNIIIRFFYNIYFTYILPSAGRIISKDNTAYKYLMKSVKDFPKDNSFLDILQSCGFKNTSFKRLTFGIADIYVGYKNN
ncbi:MAG: bifunctional demethylmenaquinone methyltransferase/2-methoxy-6-polyprenyl-1,4-benzoquinol methylase UbiE [Bacteroidales bacterium]|nr:bifunctional demethylmenaquinone methyltransferase/2-methoxy-6-polyprenyl-1,4-benzoquinol methylase UbiE [Bacteroidales bacterium]